MSLKRKFISTVSLAVAVGTFSTFVAAQDSSTTNQTDLVKKERKSERREDSEGWRGDKGMRGGKHGGDRMMMGALRRLDLTDAQKAQIKTIFESSKPNQTQFDEMRGLMQKKRDGGSLTEQEQARFREIKTQMKASAEQNHNLVLAILTAEQRTRLEQMKQEKRERHGMRRGMQKENQTPEKSDNN